MGKVRSTQPKQNQLDFFSAQAAEPIDILECPLPKLPTLFRYDDEFSLKKKTVYCSEETWKFRVDGINGSITWDTKPLFEESVLKHYIIWLSANFDASTLLGFVCTISAKKEQICREIPRLLVATPAQAQKDWEGYLRTIYGRQERYLFKTLVVFFCHMGLLTWSVEEIPFIQGWNWIGPRRAKYAGVLTGAHQLPSGSDAKIIAHFDAAAANPGQLTWQLLRDTCILYWCYQHGFRRIQIASLDVQDITVRSAPNSSHTVHATFFRAKQRTGKAKEPMPRRMKREWAPLMVQWMNWRLAEAKTIEALSDRNTSVFGMTPQAVGVSINDLMKALIGEPVSAGRLRHCAAQRMADAGASHLEMAEFMGHADIDTALVYYDASPTQASKINAALGLSPTYQKIRDISTRGFIDENTLRNLPADKQIGGANHGIMLAGIGGCTLGQSLCQLNPAINCYTCPKFMPLSDMALHQSIAAELRDVVASFVAAGRTDESNPAFMQLRHTLEGIEEIIGELGNTAHE